MHILHILGKYFNEEIHNFSEKSYDKKAPCFVWQYFGR